MLTQTNVVPVSLSPSEVVNLVFEAAEFSTVDEYVLHFTENARFQVANYPITYGEQGIRKAVAPILEVAETVTHSMDLMWEVGDTVICKAEVHYKRWDRKIVPPIPVMNIIKVEGNKVSSLMAFGDFSPLFQ